MAENLPVLDWRPRFDERSRAFRVADFWRLLDDEAGEAVTVVKPVSR